MDMDEARALGKTNSEVAGEAWEAAAMTTATAYPPMSVDQEAHLSHILGRVSERLQDKYRAGHAEHGGDLWDQSVLTLVDAGIDEALDQLAYLLTVREKLVGR